MSASDPDRTFQVELLVAAQPSAGASTRRIGPGFGWGPPMTLRPRVTTPPARAEAAPRNGRATAAS